MPPERYPYTGVEPVTPSDLHQLRKDVGVISSRLLGLRADMRDAYTAANTAGDHGLALASMKALRTMDEAMRSWNEVMELVRTRANAT